MSTSVVLIACAIGLIALTWLWMVETMSKVRRRTRVRKRLKALVRADQARPTWWDDDAA